ncbi:MULTISPECIES: LacI family DNA-binding transcriptional regulator [Tenacibaculum]|uniref:LacI family DNA-binding transcriptional regulator n=1 Tax=Tenacibaculum TaxID=104267 RepID=UPI001F0A99C9|nr:MULTISPECIES: LacI family DNA-binding transcriptional regulator [Tenacibaculum]MCH3880923.1 LacI family transcriptional regulator [Tenacibaculum aquimarinum]MCH3884201.1 LacI family transcriptional regulator [Tenacibaculum aquimarinum]MDO6599477.1 LacI family DNA-binding transcriptional regulator [Tenacibaculum sp. 1_MG-2023]
MKKLTIKDIAKEFSVSISTVSKALNDSYEISEATKEKIKKYAKENNYKPNFNAISLKNRSTKTIGVIIPTMLNYFFAQVFKGIEDAANKKGYKVITCITNQSHNKESEIIEMLSNGSIDGFILSMAKETELKKEYNHFKETIENGTPIVMFDRVAESIECDKVITDDYNGALNTVAFLHKKGHTKIAFVSTLSDLHIGKQRFLGYKKGLENVGLPFNEDLVINILDRDYKKYETLLTPFLKNNNVDSVITTGESAAVATMKCLIKSGKKIPKDVSVIAFSNGILARHSSPKLTTISQHGEQMGEAAANILIEKLEKKNTETITKIIKTDLVIRDSTR